MNLTETELEYVRRMGNPYVVLNFLDSEESDSIEQEPTGETE